MSKRRCYACGKPGRAWCPRHRALYVVPAIRATALKVYPWPRAA